MRATSTRLTPPAGFSFATTVRSHGWCHLDPFTVSESGDTLRTAVALDERRAAVVEMRHGSGGALAVTARGVGAADRPRVRAAVTRILGLDVDLAPLYAAIGDDPERAWIRARGAGRLLRAPTVWKDLVKMVLTTNCSWALTEKMVARLVRSLGLEAAPGVRAFPTPHAMAARDERFYREEIRTGYRSPSLVALARGVASGAVDLDALAAHDRPTADVRRAIIALPGCGPYVAENVLRLLGRGDFLGLDSWSRATYARRVHNDGRGTSRRLADATIERAYRRWGEYAGLVFWLDVTRHWHEDAAGSTWP